VLFLRSAPKACDAVPSLVRHQCFYWNHAESPPDPPGQVRVRQAPLGSVLGKLQGSSKHSYALDRLDDAKATVREAQRHKVDFSELHLSFLLVDFFQHEGAAMERDEASLMGIPGQEDQALNYGGKEAWANTVYQEFFSLWKDADPEIPLLRQAKAVLASLK